MKPRTVRSNLRWSLALFFGLFAVTGETQAEIRDLVPVPGSPGLYRKLIVKDDSAVLKQANGEEVPAKAFSIFFQVKTDGGQDANGEWLCVGDGEGTFFGEIKREHVYDWDTRFVLKPNPPLSDDVTFTVTGKAPDETTGELKEFSAPYIGGGGLSKEAVAPILQKPSEDDNPEFDVAFFLGTVPSIGGNGAAEQERASSNIKSTKLEIMFVIDTTASMTPLIEGTVAVVDQSVAKLAGNAELGAAVRFGLVQYRDNTPGLEFIAKLETPLTDAATFQKKLRTLAAAKMGSEETSEDVLAGLLEAIENGGWEEKVKSSKHIILLGDASALLSGPKNSTGLSIETLLDRAQGIGGELKQELDTKFIHAVRAIQAGDPDGPLAAAQFLKLSQNKGEFEAYYADFDPNDEQSVDTVVKDLVGFFQTGITAASAVKAGDTKKLKQLADPEKSNSQLAQGLYRIVVAGGGTINDPVPRGKAFVRSSDGDLLAAQYVMVSEDDLSRVESTLSLLKKGLSKGADPAKRKEVPKLLEILKTSLAAATAGQDLDPNKPLEAFVDLMPLKTDVLRTKPVDLATMTPEAYENWLKSLEDARKRAADLILGQTDKWMQLSEQAANSKYAYILVDDMP